MRLVTYECLKICMPKFPLIHLYDKTLTCKMPSSFACDGGVTFLLCCVNSTCLCKFDQVRLEFYDCLNDCMITSSLINMNGTLETKKLLFHDESIDQACVFKPRICYFGSICGELKQSKFCVNHLCLFIIWPLTQETKFRDSDHNLKSFLVHSMLLVINFLIHHEKVRLIDVFESRQLNLNVVEKISGDIVFKRPRYFALANFLSLFVVDNFILSGGMKSCLLKVIYVEKSVNDIGLIQPVQTLDVRDSNHSHKKLDLIYYDGYVKSLHLSMKFSSMCMLVWMNFNMFDCLNLFMPKSYLFDMWDLLVTAAFLLYCDRNQVVKPGVCFHKLLINEAKHHEFILHKCVKTFHLLIILSLCSKTKHVNSDGLRSQNQIFDSGGCTILWFK
ncbi:uncharacterized protein [Gossypium hirsutum]|uniref:Uncharacterized protein n=1 Tax=Gossypium hirsutum TaxID=3635 RepID=A0ABM3AYZ6_GOSHI|nr:uncharacterized protein LOC121223087 [Gossypium hirsutum]XP_040960008.1 uncharacterized protein LOC121223087 [Gossypium hirsutum]